MPTKRCTVIMQLYNVAIVGGTGTPRHRNTGGTGTPRHRRTHGGQQLGWKLELRAKKYPLPARSSLTPSALPEPHCFLILLVVELLTLLPSSSYSSTPFAPPCQFLPDLLVLLALLPRPMPSFSPSSCASFSCYPTLPPYPPNTARRATRHGRGSGTPERRSPSQGCHRRRRLASRSKPAKAKAQDSAQDSKSAQVSAQDSAQDSKQHIMHTYIHTYMHAYIHTYMHTYIHA